ncbi:MAG: CHASE domain-containing protein, partial [Pseudomonadota bacterium]|nr:CHASE domain-containing protein [Pseudomonadota bacterium]
YAFERDLHTALETLKFIGDYYNSSLFVERDEFRTFVGRMLAEREGIAWLAWAPRVDEVQRISQVARVRAEGFTDFEIRQRSADGRLEVAGSREVYFPVIFAEPLAGNEHWLGFDLGAEPAYRQALEQARDSGQLVIAVAASPDNVNHGALLAFWPVYAKWRATDTVAQRREHLQGFALAMLRLTAVATRAQPVARPSELPQTLAIYDLAAPPGRETLYGPPPQGPLRTLVETADGGTAFRLARGLAVGGRQWLAVVDTDPSRLAAFRQATPLGILLLGVLLTLTLVAYLISTLSRAATVRRLVDEQTRDLTAGNRELAQALAQLREAQDQLVQTEKLASLGGLVAGVAHEINTPVGVSVTAASTLRARAQELKAAIDQGQLKRSTLSAFIDTLDNASRIILANLERAAELIQSFKEVAVDQSSSARRRFALRHYIDEVLLSLRPQLKKTAHRVEVNCDPELTIDSYPGAFSQILTNLVQNSLVHAYAEGDAGVITIDAQVRDGRLHLRYADDGRGIAAEHLGRIFEPFYTTRRGSGGSGLGLHIVYNLVTSTLGGRIRAASEPGKGTEFVLILPLTQGE